MEQETMWVIGIIVSFVSLIFGMLVKRINNMDARMRQALSKQEVKELIQDKMMIHDFRLDGLKEDLKAMDQKLDKLLEARDK